MNINNLNNNKVNKKNTLFKQSNLVEKSQSSNSVKLPIINSSRPTGSGGGKINLDIKNILNECGEYKEDPVIKMKLNSIMNDIVEINKVITTKTNNNRIKISSAPTQPNTADNNQDGNKDEKIFTFSKFPHLSQISQVDKFDKANKKFSSKNVEINLNNFNTKKIALVKEDSTMIKKPIKMKSDQFKLDANSQIIKYNQKAIKFK